MTYLLDTCVLLWYFSGSNEIPDRVKDALTDTANRVLASEVSALEVTIKHSIGKLPLRQPPKVFWEKMILKHAFESLPLSMASILAWGDLPLLHRDPFDRLLISQARTNQLCLVTPDPLIRNYDVKSWWGEL